MTHDLHLQLQLRRNNFSFSVDIHLPSKGISVLFGPSGSGKTTLLRCVAGLEPHARGVVRIGEQTWQDDQKNICLPVWQRDLGYVFQEASLFEHLNVQRNIEYGLQRAKQDKRTLDAAVQLLGIESLLNRSINTLSGGERQRVAIARALATQPKLLLLDEPMAALDFARRQEILPWLEALRDELNTPMLYVTHSADEAARLADHLVILEAGSVRASGAVNDVLASIENPVVIGGDAGTLVNAHIAEKDAQWHLVRAAFDGGSFWVRDNGQPTGKAVRLRILARDISIQLQEPSQTSIQNHLPALIEAIATSSDPSQALIQLRCGNTRLLARVTQRAVHSLSLKPTMLVWAQIKAVAVID